MPPVITKKDIIREIEDNQTILREDIEISESKNDDDDGLKAPMTQLLDLSDEQINRLKSEVFALFDLIDQERKEEMKKAEELEAQYKGAIIPEPNIEFNMNVPVTMVKCDSVERLTIKALTESDPKFVSSLRPEAMRQGMDQDDVDRVQKAQEDYLDYQLDERININSPLRKVVHQATALRGGLMKIPYVYKRKRKVREEYYSGKRVDSGQVDAQEEPIFKPEGLEEFLRNYPKAVLPGEAGNAEFKKLVEFEDITFEAKYWAVVEDNPKPKFVDTKNFWCRKSTEGYDGLCNEQIYFEMVPYTFWEMQGMESSEEMVNVDEMRFNSDKLSDTDINKDYKIKEHKILEITYHFKMEESDEEETKIICRFGKENKVFLGAFEYPYYITECIYVPFYITDKMMGWYKTGLAEILTDSNRSQNAILNMMLTEVWLELVTTPIVREGSTIADQLLSKSYQPGVPLTIAHNENIKEEIGFVDKPQKSVAGQMMNMLLFLGKMDDQRTGVSDIAATGGGDPLDPRAPAAKTAMLLKQSGINIEDYIGVIVPSFNKVAEIILKLTYQMSNSGRKFKGKQIGKRVTGQEIFSELSRNDMILETTIQSRAAGFAFDKINEKRENLALATYAATNPIISRNPKAMHEIAVTLLESWSPQWRAKAEKIALSNEDFNQEITKVGLQALNTYMTQLSEEAKVTGQAPNPDIKQFLAMVGQMMAQVATPTPEEVKANK